MALGKTTAEQTIGLNHQPTSPFLGARRVVIDPSVARRVFFVTLASGLIGLGLSPLLNSEKVTALSVEPRGDRSPSALNTSTAPRSSLVSSPQSDHSNSIQPYFSQPPFIQPTTLEHQTITQLPDILWDIIPADVLPPGIIPDSDFLEFIQDAGELIQTVSDRRGQYALLTASALANDHPQLVSWLSQVQDSPIGTMTFSGIELGDFAEQLTTTLTERDRAVDAIALQSQQESTTDPSVDFETLPDLREQGPFNVMTETMALTGVMASDLGSAEQDSALGAAKQDSSKQDSGGMVDIYVPVPVDSAELATEELATEELATEELALGEADTHHQAVRPAPVIVISHGAGGARQHFSALANHLTSYGFIVVVPDHTPIDRAADASTPSSSVTAQLTQLGEQLFGELNPVEFIQRPLTVSAILDELEHLNTSDPKWMGRLDVENVGIIGHSLGGYTGLALASGELNPKQVKRTCKDDEVLASNLSLVFQCQAEALPRRLPSLEDERIKAVMALNPIASAVLGEKQIEDIEVPVMIVAGSHDAIAPMMFEQLPTFSWLTSPHKYLVTMVPAGHASVNLNNPAQLEGLAQVVSGPPQALGAEATQALSVAFMQTHLAPVFPGIGDSEQYLNSTYGHYLSDAGLMLHLVTELDEI